MTPWTASKVQQVCPRCGGPPGEATVLCDVHAEAARLRWLAWASKARPARRRARKCAYCGLPSLAYGCKSCRDKQAGVCTGDAVHTSGHNQPARDVQSSEPPIGLPGP